MFNLVTKTEVDAEISALLVQLADHAHRLQAAQEKIAELLRWTGSEGRMHEDPKARSAREAIGELFERVAKTEMRAGALEKMLLGLPTKVVGRLDRLEARADQAESSPSGLCQLRREARSVDALLDGRIEDLSERVAGLERVCARRAVNPALLHAPRVAPKKRPKRRRKPTA